MLTNFYKVIPKIINFFHNLVKNTYTFFWIFLLEVKQARNLNRLSRNTDRLFRALGRLSRYFDGLSRYSNRLAEFGYKILTDWTYRLSTVQIDSLKFRQVVLKSRNVDRLSGYLDGLSADPSRLSGFQYYWFEYKRILFHIIVT